MSSLDPTPIPSPVIPIPALPYSIPMRSGRPGIITAIGVMCIVVACLSGISSFATGVYPFVFFMMAKMVPAMNAAQASGATSFTGAPVPQTATLSGSLPSGDVGVAENSLKPMLSLDGPHLRELDHLLRSHGRDVFGGNDQTPFTVTWVQNAVSSIQPQVANSAAQFSTPQGTVTVEWNRATFISADGSTTIVTSALNRSDQTTTSSGGSQIVYSYHTTSSVSPPTTLTPAQVSTVLTAVNSMSKTLNAAQLASLNSELSKPNQVLVLPAAATSTGNPVISVLAPPNGNAVITFNTGNQLVLAPNGRVILSGMPGLPNFNINGTVVLVLCFEAVASIVWAIYLLVVGIQVFRASFRSQRLLKVYAWVKIPLALTAGVGLSLLGYQFATGMANSFGTMGNGAAPPTGPVAGIFIAWGCGMALVGMAFPIGLLIALRSRRVRDYYNAVAQEI